MASTSSLRFFFDNLGVGEFLDAASFQCSQILRMSECDRFAFHTLCICVSIVRILNRCPYGLDTWGGLYRYSAKKSR